MHQTDKILHFINKQFVIFQLKKTILRYVFGFHGFPQTTDISEMFHGTYYFK